MIVATDRDLTLTADRALSLVPHVARAQIDPLRIGHTTEGPIVVLAVETARLIAADRLSAIADSARGRLLLARQATLRAAVARSVAGATPDEILRAADAHAEMGHHMAGRPTPATDTGRTGLLSAGQSARLAAWLGLPYAETLVPCDSTRFARLVETLPDQACTVHGDGQALLALVPSRDQLANLTAAACTRSAAALCLVFTHADAIRAGNGARRATRQQSAPQWDLGLPPALSARRVLSPAQRLIAPPLAAAAALGAIAVPQAVPMILSGFMGSVLLALAATRGAASVAPSVVAYAPPRRPLRDGSLPAYSVLVPLYREAASVPALVRCLDRLEYPRDRLEILYLLEPDDAETRAAFEARALPEGHRTLRVPAEGPRTKPKALNAGLSVATGSLVTIFDAEDRPDPAQLRIAAETFAAGGERLACLQARLAIDHARDTWITRMFALEYACLFDVLLPWLARYRLFFPLGGTSNHFRRAVLLRLGGWDPYNVTEDADLGVRLTRFDYEMSLIASTTYEEAPLHMRAWMRQRSRWLKGWMQTWWVHMRRPGRFGRTRTFAKITVFQSLILGSLLAILAFPLCLAFMLAHLAGVLPLVGGDGLWPMLAIGLNGTVFVLGFSATAALSVRAMRLRGLAIPPWRLAELPLYWLAMAAALVIAVIELARRPHHWAKTTHGLARRPRLRRRRRRNLQPVTPGATDQRGITPAHHCVRSGAGLLKIPDA
ncbi:glycosyltransferase [Amorphus coralli]|uniref:glycosyltransferase n=1 Tax=Amorphus coralli TaxID=340680 RepID=UPI00036F15FF|nr:glycosyltransferase [Amorphus coralli]